MNTENNPKNPGGRWTYRMLVVVFFIAFFSDSVKIQAQDLFLPEGFPEFIISENNDPDDGYIFMTTRQTSVKAPAGLVMVDNYGTPVFYQYLPGASGGFTLQRNGLLSYRTNNRFYIMDSTYMTVDSVWMETYELDGHDFIALENGNYLIFGLDARTTDMTAHGGIVDASVEGVVIQELDPDKNVVFEWNSWDHFEITDTYKDLTTSVIDMAHPNSLEIDYDGNILLISRAMNEVTKISRTNGDILWRLGGKNNQFTFSDSSHMFSRPHDFRLLPNGNYTIFDNGSERDPRYSRAIEYHINEDNKTCDLVWEYDANKEIFGPSGGSTRRLPSGNTILGYGGKASKPASIEVHPDGSKALQIDFVEEMSSGRTTKANWRTTLFEANTYEINFGEWDGYSENFVYPLKITNNADHLVSLTGYSTRTGGYVIEESFPIDIPAKGEATIRIKFYPISIDDGYIPDVLTIDSDINSDTLIRRVSQQIKLFGTQYDVTKPSAVFLQSDKQGLDLNATLTVELSEPVRMLDGSLFTYETVDQLVSLKAGDALGEDVPFDAVINSDKKLITIIPEQNLEHTSAYYLAFSDQYEDFAGNQGSPLSGVFHTIDMTSPLGNITPVNGEEQVEPKAHIFINFDEAVRLSNDSLITSNALDTIIIFKKFDADGPEVSFEAEINEDNDQIEIIPDERMADNTAYFVTMTEGIEDLYGNAYVPDSSFFTTGVYLNISPGSSDLINLYPNPGNGLYQLEFSKRDNYELTVYELTGRKILSEKLKQTDNHLIDIRSFAKGIYLLRIEGSKNNYSSTIHLIKE